MTVKEILYAVLIDSEAGDWEKLGKLAKVSGDLIRKTYDNKPKMSPTVAKGLHNNLGYDWNWLMTGEGKLKKQPIIDKRTEEFDERIFSKTEKTNLEGVNQTPNDLKDMIAKALKEIGRLEYEIDLIKKELEILRSPKKSDESGEGGVAKDGRVG